MKKVLFTIFALIVMTGCSTLKVDVDYDTAYDFNKSTTYAVVYNDGVVENSLINDRITQAIKTSLNEKNGYKEVSKESAELLFVFHVNVQDKSDVSMDYQMIGYGGYGFGRGFGLGYGGVVASPNTYNYKEGKLVIDALNQQTNKIVWRGSASDELSQSSSTPDEKTKYINSVVSKIMANFPPKKEQ